MLTIRFGGDEYYNEETEEFQKTNEVVLELEHSLLSLSKWESKYQKPFLSGETKTPDELFGYLEAMVLTPDVDPGVIRQADKATIEMIQKYIDSTQSATTFGEMPERRGPGEVITSELIYYWMVAYTIPFEVERWHLNRLFALVRICNVKSQKAKPLSKNQIAQRNHELNMKRRQQLGTKG